MTAADEIEGVDLLAEGSYEAVTFTGMVHQVTVMPDALRGGGLMLEAVAGADRVTCLIPEDHALVLHAYLSRHIERHGLKL